jgi:DNA ligase-1
MIQFDDADDARKYKDAVGGMILSGATAKKPLPTLYNKRSDGGTQQWTIEIEGNKYRSVSGQVDGELVTAKWTVAKGKNIGRSNETSPEDQAYSEAKAKWQKKVDKGYTPDKDKVGTTGPFKPMLARKYEDVKITFPVMSQAKLDGIRCIATKDGLVSRNGKPLPGVPHIFEALKPLFDKNPDLVLDGELYNHKLKDDFNQIVSYVRKAKPDAARLAKSKELVEYWVYDIPSSGDDAFEKRQKELEKIIKTLGRQKMIRCVKTKVSPDQKSLDTLYAMWIGEGFEGQMVRTPDSKYENKRSKFLLKRKEFITEEFEIIGMEEGTGNREGTAGSTQHVNKDGKPFNSNIKGTREFVRELWDNRDGDDSAIGKEATIRFFEYTPDGIPRFPFVIAIRDYE